MTQSDAMNRDKRLYLDDLHVGQRFTPAERMLSTRRRSRHLPGSLIRSRFTSITRWRPARSISSVRP